MSVEGDRYAVTVAAELVRHNVDYRHSKYRRFACFSRGPASVGQEPQRGEATPPVTVT